MDLCKKEAQSENTPEVTRETSEFDASMAKNAVVSIVDVITDSLETSPEKGPGDFRLLEFLYGFRRAFDTVQDLQSLGSIIKKGITFANTNNSVKAPDLRDDLQEIYNHILEQFSSSKKELVPKQPIPFAPIRVSQLNPRLETDPYQSQPMKTPGGGEILRNPVTDDRMLELPEKIHIDENDKAKFEEIYQTISKLTTMLDNTSHPSTKVFERLRIDLEKAGISAWRLLYQLKNS